MLSQHDHDESTGRKDEIETAGDHSERSNDRLRLLRNLAGRRCDMLRGLCHFP
jgi:hypothetical protein